jgi:hypothetical protein
MLLSSRCEPLCDRVPVKSVSKAGLEREDVMMKALTYGSCTSGTYSRGTWEAQAS